MSTTVTATDGKDTDSVEIKDNYVLIVDGAAYRHSVVVHNLRDGTQTHVITVKGIRR